MGGGVIYTSKPLKNLFLYLFALIFSQNILAQYSGGSGTQADPYKISTPEDLIALSDNVNKGNSYQNTYFVMTNDIDMVTHYPKNIELVYYTYTYPINETAWDGVRNSYTVMAMGVAEVENGKFVVEHGKEIKDIPSDANNLTIENTGYATNNWHDGVQDVFGDITITVNRHRQAYDFTPIGFNGTTFKGSFDGKGFKIYDLVIVQEDKDNVGLFSKLESNSASDEFIAIQGIGLENAVVIGRNNVGGIVGQVMRWMGGGTQKSIKDCFVVDSYVEAVYKNNQGGNKVGGLVGELDGNDKTGLENCYVYTVADKKHLNCVKGMDYVGGLVGDAHGFIRNCFFDAHVYEDAMRKHAGPIEGSNGTDNAQYVSLDTHLYFVKDWQEGEGEGVTTTDGNQEFINNETKCEDEEDLRTKVLNDPALKDVFKANPLDPDGVPILATQISALAQTMGLSETELTDNSFIRLYVDKWNLIGAEGGVEVLADNHGGKNEGTDYANDMACAPYDYSTDSWDYTSIANGDKLSAGAAYFVYPFTSAPYEYKDGKAQDGTNKPLDNPTYLGNHVTYLKATASPKSITLTSLADQTKGIFYALANGKDAQMDLGDFKTANNGKFTGEFVWVYDPVNTGTNDHWFTKELKAGVKIDRNQGFMVQSTTNGEKTFVLHSAKKSDVQTSPQDIQRMVFNTFANGRHSEALARQSDESADGIDDMDSYAMLVDDMVQPYFAIDNYDVFSTVFKSYPYTVPVNFHSTIDASADLYVSNVPSDVEVYVVDLSNGEMTLISDGSKFTFNATKGENADRFAIKFVSKNTGINDIAAKEQTVSIYNRNDEVFINGNDLQHVDVINVLGQTVKTCNINANEYKLSLAGLQAGTYVVKVKSRLSECSTKITVH